LFRNSATVSATTTAAVSAVVVATARGGRHRRKTIAIDSAETARAIDFCREFFQKTMFEDVLGWTDPSNNKAYLSEQISCTTTRKAFSTLPRRTSRISAR